MDFFSHQRWRYLLSLIVVLLGGGGVARLFSVQKTVSDWYFFVGMALICAGIIVILARAALFAGWNMRRVGESDDAFRARIKNPKEIAAQKNRPLKLSQTAKTLLIVGIICVIGAIIITL